MLHPPSTPIVDLEAVLKASQNTLTFSEASEASHVVRRQLTANHEIAKLFGRELRESPPRLVATCARGSSDHAATFAKYLIESRRGVTTTSAAPSLSSLFFESNGAPDVLFLAISQSGKSPDLLAATGQSKAAGSTVVALVNDETAPLAGLADIVLPLKAGVESSVAATKSFIASLAAMLQLTAHWSNREDLLALLDIAPDLLGAAWNLDWSEGIEAFVRAESLYVLGRGVGLGAAQEMALKFKETCSIHAEAFSSAEVRHGPMSIIGEGFPVLVLGQDDESMEGVRTIAEELVARGARVFTAGFDLRGGLALPSLKAPAALQPMLLAQSFYRMINAVAVGRGLDPDKPPHLAKVTETL